MTATAARSFSAALMALGLAALAGCATPDVPKSEPPAVVYAWPAPGLTVDYSHVANGKGDPAKAAVRQVILSNDDEYVVNHVIDLENDSVRESRTFRALITDRVYQRGDGLVVERIQPERLRLLWPMVPGNTATSTGRTYFGRGRTERIAARNLRRTGTSTTVFKILRREWLTIPAGTFDTIVVNRVTTQKNLRGVVTGVSDKTYWIALDIRWLIRLDTVNTKPGQPAERASLVAIRVVRPVSQMAAPAKK